MDDVTKTDKMLARKDGRVGYVIFNNPERHNAVSLDMWAATRRILDGFVNDEEVRVVVLTGAGGKAFVSGADVSKFESERGTLDATRHYGATVEQAYAAIEQFRGPSRYGGSELARASCSQYRATRSPNRGAPLEASPCGA